MDENLKNNLLLLREAVTKKDFDGIYCVDGMEGSGKSTLAFQSMKVLYPEFTVDDIVFTGEQFLKKVEECPPKTGIVWDEAGSAAGSTEVMRKIQNTIRKKLQIIREKNLFICLVIPSIFGLQTYFAVWRTRFLIHIYTKGFDRGWYTFYNYPNKKILYLKGKKSNWSYDVVKPDFKGRFTSGYAIPENEYRALKRKLSEAVAEEEDTVQKARNRYMFNLNELLISKKYPVTQEEIGEVFELDRSRVSRILRSQSS